MKRSIPDVTLSVGTDELFLPLVTAFVERAADCYGLAKEESLGLTLAAEEVFMYLCRVVTPSGGPVEIVCSSAGYCARAAFSLPADALDLRAFNLTTTISIEDEEDLDAMGLVLASRSVDRFFFSHEKGRDFRLTLVKERTYPASPIETPAPVSRPDKIVLRPAGPEELKFISQCAASRYDSPLLSDILRFPGKLADMIRAGEYDSLAAVGSAGEIGGAVFWHRIGEHMVECIGPYVFVHDPAQTIAEELLDGCIGAVARTSAVGIINTRPTPEFSRRHFELLGTLDACTTDGSRIPVEAWFRLLHEDLGAAVWVHPGLDAFARREYARLVLPREIRIDRPAGESPPRHSVISAEFDRLRSRVALRPMWPGADAKENIERHIRLVENEKIRNIHFLIDLGQAWQNIFVPGLLDAGFEPRMLMPYAGNGDVVVFQLGETPLS